MSFRITTSKMQNSGEILSKILLEYGDCYFFVHNTKEFTIVQKILSEGFRVESQLANTTDRVNPHETIEISYFFVQRKEYGSYTIVIAFPKDTYDKYSAIAVDNEVPIEEVMTVDKPLVSENDDFIYTISKHHILGYYNISNHQFIKNPEWNPGFINLRK